MTVDKDFDIVTYECIMRRVDRVAGRLCYGAAPSSSILEMAWRDHEKRAFALVMRFWVQLVRLLVMTLNSDECDVDVEFSCNMLCSVDGIV
jgi:hypothetical protein